ncbi:esterase family protein [Gordonia sp. PP30]|uniref:alpha/beta hydrolase n=1 Tax=Gordonia sp. PP30 TaxID=2935861 RepID=UPI001FFE996C|nr:alpha/beta hydrolase family protein [Gordonia sp. PP30]UQE75625.1 esterase family protein [Gordonia sp. PP30]
MRAATRTALAIAAAAMLAAPGVASADPQPAPSPAAPAPSVPPQDSAASSHIVAVSPAGPQQETIVVYSAAMDRNIPLTVLRPRDVSKPAPILYLLNGAGGGEDDATWQVKTDYVKFFADKHVNVVTPIGGAFSYYTDWVKDDPVLGRNKWQTFLTKELPPLLDKQLGSTGTNAIAGISMAGTSVLNLAIAAPKLYRAAASYSGCGRTSDGLGQAYIRTVVEDRGRGDVTNMWGPLDGPGWKANDPYLNAAKLRGTKVYLASGTGLPGEFDTLGARLINGDAAVLADQLVTGGAIEASVHSCTVQMADALARAKVDDTVILRPTGTHSWQYWEQDLYTTWPSIERDLNRR